MEVLIGNDNVGSIMCDRLCGNDDVGIISEIKSADLLLWQCGLQFQL